MSAPTSQGRTALRARWKASSGVQLVELLVAMTIAATVAVITIGVLVSTGMMVVRSTSATTTLSQLEDASGQLLRDVNDGRKITTASPDALTVQVLRNSVCTERAWTISGGDLLVTTSVYSTERCTGGADVSTMDVVQGEFTAVAPFHYYSALSQTNEMPQPVSLNDVTRVTWELTAKPSYEGSRELEVTSGAAFTGRGASSDGTGSVQDATRPVLQVATARVGVDKPVLSWTDTSPELTGSWTVYRIANPEGTGSGTATTWTAVMRLGATMLSWTDTTLPDGYTAQYTVQATLADTRQGPTSNQVSTGLRPSAPTTTATGQQSSIRLSWTRTDGADAWDVYRDGALLRTWSQVQSDGVSASASEVTWTDPTGVGRSHNYRVVAVNRWERAATSPTGASSSGSQRYVVPVGTADSAELGEPGFRSTRLASEATAAAGAFTAPATPTIATTETTGADWQNSVTWTAASWTGAGPTQKGSVHRDRSWEAQHRASTSIAWADLWAGGGAQVGAAAARTAIAQYSEAQVAGQYRHYQVRTCNAVGCSSWSGPGSALQRPATPTCSAVATSTRSATVDVSRPAMASAYTSTEVVGGTPADGHGVAGVGQENKASWVIDHLRHSTGQGFAARNGNGSKANGGWSNQAACSTTTPVLGVSITGLGSGTWYVDASMGLVNGSSSNLTLEGFQTVNATSHRFADLRHNTGYTVTARNSDGVNAVVAQSAVATVRLVAPTPASPSCSATSDRGYAPTTARFSSSNGSMSRSSATASSAGYYSATATTSTRADDGHGNVVTDSRSASCGVTVRTGPSTGGTPGAASGACASFRDSGDVIGLLRSAQSASAAGDGFRIGESVSGSSSADYGSFLGGSASDRTLRCSMYRAHRIYDNFDGSYTGLNYLVSAIWSMSSAGGV